MKTDFSTKFKKYNHYTIFPIEGSRNLRFVLKKVSARKRSWPEIVLEDEEDLPDALIKELYRYGFSPTSYKVFPQSTKLVYNFLENIDFEDRAVNEFVIVARGDIIAAEDSRRDKKIVPLYVNYFDLKNAMKDDAFSKARKYIHEFADSDR